MLEHHGISRSQCPDDARWMQGSIRVVSVGNNGPSSNSEHEWSPHCECKNHVNLLPLPLEAHSNVPICKGFLLLFFKQCTWNPYWSTLKFKKSGRQNEESPGIPGVPAHLARTRSSEQKSESVHRWWERGVAWRGVHLFLGLWMCQDGGRRDGYRYQVFTECDGRQRRSGLPALNLTSAGDIHFPQSNTPRTQRPSRSSFIWSCLHNHSKCLPFSPFQFQMLNWRPFWQ